LVDEIHKRDMKIMIDIVYNHTSYDSILSKDHPEYFYKKNGEFSNKVGDWWDIIDLDYSNHDLWNYQIDTLKYWAFMVDGFRCDVASILPIEFWKQAKSSIKAIKSDFIWLCESTHLEFLRELRKNGFIANSDSTMHEAFDITYEYDIEPYKIDFLKGNINAKEYAEKLNYQNMILPNEAIKLRFLENHDTKRINEIVKDKKKVDILTAFNNFQRGTALIYNGQEGYYNKQTSLFDKDTIEFNEDENFKNIILKIKNIKNELTDFQYSIEGEEDTLIIKYQLKDKKVYGYFNLSKEKELEIDFNDGIYNNLFDDSTIEVKNGKLNVSDIVIIGN
ncbi:MAG: alpha-amylase family glycosyl hydrolase, partial [Tissierellia bacterium]|nr:alpha-amylase family glycosyl hydrolase [Tissierellia bacterium]